jgi:hypothetical protein
LKIGDFHIDDASSQDPLCALVDRHWPHFLFAASGAEPGKSPARR